MSARIARRVINLIDKRSGNLAGQSPLDHPGFVQEFAELREVMVPGQQ